MFGTLSLVTQNMNHNPADPVPAAADKLTLLIVDDEAPVRRSLVRYLSSYGYHMLEASDGIDALAVAAAHTGRIHILVTDVVMPRMGGRELAQRLAAHEPIVVVISGYVPANEDARWIEQSGATYLEKPFRPEMLAAAIRRAVSDSQHKLSAS